MFMILWKKQDIKFYIFKYVKYTCNELKRDFSPCPCHHTHPYSPSKQLKQQLFYQVKKKKRIKWKQKWRPIETGEKTATYAQVWHFYYSYNISYFIQR